MTVTLRVAVRADASPRIGTGHVVRCLTLADELRQHGDTAIFVARPLSEGLGELILAHGHELVTLSAADADWQADGEQTAAILAHRSPCDWIIVDHYALDARWEARVRSAAARVMAIDDLADRRHDCDLLLDQNYYRDMDRRYDGLVPAHCRKLLGPRHALLRPEFVRDRGRARAPGPGVERIVVCFGGIDAGNETCKAIRAIQGTSLRAVVDVVVGAGNPHRSEVMRACESDARFRFHLQPENLAQLMLQADLALGSCGTMNWERCALGVPSLVLVTAANQARAAHDLAAAGACVSLGESDRVSIELLKAAILQLVADRGSRRRLQAAALALMPIEPDQLRGALLEGAHA